MVSRAADVVDRGKVERRRQILEAAKHVFAEAGYHGASINAIIERAQIARGTFYLYFQSKAAVFDSILDQAMANLRALIRRIEWRTPARRRRRCSSEQVVATLGYVVRDRALATLLCRPRRRRRPRAAERLNQFYDEVRRLIERALEQGTAPGPGAQVPAEPGGRALLGMVRGVIEVMMRGSEPLSVDEVVSEVIAVGLRGVLAHI
ncbi:MAG: TetR/AcrR family transcriptional regulator [Myxococcales bacterium]|nr:TetR/AcrR family transcriptional regulator [Myxococcales bacterium]